MIPTLTLSLGATNPVPPRTCRGRIATAAAADPALAMNRRRETPEDVTRLMAYLLGEPGSGGPLGRTKTTAFDESRHDTADPSPRAAAAPRGVVRESRHRCAPRRCSSSRS